MHNLRKTIEMAAGTLSNTEFEEVVRMMADDLNGNSKLGKTFPNGRTEVIEYMIGVAIESAKLLIRLREDTSYGNKVEAGFCEKVRRRMGAGIQIGTGMVVSC